MTPRHTTFGWLAGVAILLGITAACTGEDERIEMRSVPPPTGGVVETIVTVDEKNETRILAPTRSELFVRSGSDSPWIRRPVEWPKGWRQAAASPLAGVMWAKDSFNFPSKQRFTSHRGRIWILTRHGPSDRVQLLVSADGGSNWKPRELPDRYRTPGAETSDDRGPRGAELARVNVRAPLRLVDHGDQGLYLLDENNVWRADFSDENETLVDWTRVPVSDIDVLESATSSTLPTVIRNYLPATDERPFELLTTFGDRLYVYRRHRDDDNWLLVSTLPTIDLELYALPESPMIYLLSHSALYRSGEYGERWEKLTIGDPEQSLPGNRTLAFVDREDSENQVPPYLVLGTDEGSIYRSENGGDSWDLVREPDPDAREITGIASEPGTARVWASTAGLGTLQSDDRGESWSQNSRGMRATRPLALDVGLNNELVLGTRAGLFRLTGAPDDGHWDRFHDRATSAIAVDRDRTRLHSGTLGGTVVTETNTGATPPTETVSVDQADAPLFRPWSTPASVTEPEAIVALRARPESESMYAWSRERGMLRSENDGDTWKREPLNLALVSALEQSLVDNFDVGDGERMYLTSYGFSANRFGQLWRSDNDGETWHAVFATPSTQQEKPRFLRRSTAEDDEHLYLAQGERLQRSTDGGNSWTELDGPWSEATIRAYSLREGRHTIAYQTPQSAHVASARDTGTDSMSARSYALGWSNRDDAAPPEIRDIRSADPFVFAITDDVLYAGTVPKGESQFPHAPTIIATLIFVLGLIGLSFWYLRFET